MRVTLFIKAALEALLVNKFRSFLTILGIVIGIAAIVIIISVGSGIQSLIISQISTFGSEIIGIAPGSSDEGGPPASLLGITITTLTSEDADAIRNQVSGIEALSGYVNGVGTISWESESIDSRFAGVSSEYPEVESAYLAYGDFFTDDDDRSLRNVAVLGWQVYTDLFGDTNPIGQRVKVKQKSFRVIGVIEERGTVLFQNQDDQIFIPLRTAQKQMLGIDHVSLIRLKAKKGYELSEVTKEVQLLLRERHETERTGVDDFTVRNVAQALNVLETVTDSLKYFLAAVSALSLLVGGIGVMNIMLVSILERTRELGLRKAVGARPIDLRIQFLSETVIISLIGGIAGLILGIIISYGIAVLANLLGYHWDYTIGASAILLAVVFPLITGLIFGFYPAEKAAKLKPIEALRYE